MVRSGLFIMLIFLSVVVWSQQGSPIYHTVQPKETLYRLSVNYNSSVDEIKRWNNLRSNELGIGQKLIVGYSSSASSSQNRQDLKPQYQPPPSYNNETQVQTPAGPIYHTVQRGETLYRIAVMYNTTVDNIKKLNRLYSNELSIGQKLIAGYDSNADVPAYEEPVKKEVVEPTPKETVPQPYDSRGPEYHTVQPGETLYRLFVKYGTPVDDIKRWNGLTSNSLSVGQRVIVNYGSSQAQTGMEEYTPPPKPEYTPPPTVEDDYTNAINQGNAAFDQGNFVQAKTWFMVAVSFNPDETYARDKINEIEQVLKRKDQRLDVREEYDMLITNADAAFEDENYLSAKSNYEKASTLLRDEQYPQEMLQKVDRAIEQKRDYEVAIKKGDNSFNYGNYEMALQHYDEALLNKPDDPYATDRIKEIEEILAQPEESYEPTTTGYQQEASDYGDDSYTEIKEFNPSKVKETWFFELAFLIVPSSASLGPEIHFDIPLRRTTSKDIFPTLGFGGGMLSHKENDYQFTDYTADVKIFRYQGQATFGARFLLNSFALNPRVGYNFTWAQFKYDSFSNCGGCSEDINNQLHRVQYEIVGQMPFVRRRMNFGFMVGVRFIHQFSNKDQNVFLIKSGFTF